MPDDVPDSPDRLDEEGRSEELREDLELRASWVGLEETDALAANHFVSQFYNDTFYVAFGRLTPPVLLGDPEQKIEQAKKLDFVPIHPVARVALDPEAMEELIGVLQSNLDRYRRKKEEGDDSDSDSG